MEDGTKKAAGMYDARAAERRLRELVGNGPEHLQERLAAGRALIEEFAALARRCPLETSHSLGKCTVVVSKVEVTLTLVEASGRIEVRRWAVGEAGPVRVGPDSLPLAFNTFTKRVEGAEIDTAITPTPGEYRPWRSALDVLVEEVMKLAGNAPHT